MKGSLKHIQINVSNPKAEFDTPRERPEMGTYYQVMFLDPDNLALEVVYTDFQ